MRLIWALLVGLVLCATPSMAQPLPDTLRSAGITVAEIESVRRGLVAQYEVALIRERQLADEREIRVINEAVARLTEARTEADAGSGTESTLQQARQAFADLVGQIAARDATTRVQVEAYRAETQQQTTEATPERLAALQRFADGDRVGAYPDLEALRLEEDRAAEAAFNARRAVRWREDAALVETMRLNGEKTVQDVLQVLNEAARLDPTHFATQQKRAELAFLSRDTTTAYAALDAADRAALTDEQRIPALRWRSAVAGVQRRYADQHRLAVSAVELARRAVAANANDPAPTQQLVDALRDLAYTHASHGEMLLAVAAAEEAVATGRALVRSYPGEAAYQIMLAQALVGFGDAENGIMNLSRAREHYEDSLATLESMARGGVRDFRVLSVQRIALTELALVQSQLGEPQLSRQSLAESLRIAEMLARADAGNVATQEDLEETRELQRIQNALSDAQARKESEIRQLGDMRDYYAREHPGDPDRQFALALMCMNLAKTHGELGERAEAYALIDEALGYARQVAAANPRSAEYQDELHYVLSEASALRARFGDAAAGRALAEEALIAAQAGMRLDPADYDKASDVFETMWTLRSQFQSERVRWSDIVLFLARLEPRREFSPHQRDRLALARVNASREPARR